MSNLYFEAGNALHKILELKKSLKNVLYAHNKQLKQQRSDKSGFKKLFALVCKAVKHKGFLLDICERHGVFKEVPKKKYVVLALLCELVYGIQRIQGGGHLKKHLMGFWEAMEGEIVQERIRAENADKPVLPLRFARVNTLKISITRAISFLTAEGFKKVSYSAVSSAVKQVVESQSDSQSDKKSKPQTALPSIFCIDSHIPSLLVFPSGYDLHAHKLVVSGKLLLQDKASCCPAFLLNPPKNSVVIDTCAAPGNKTSHLAALMKNTGELHAWEINEKRFTLLESRLEKAGVRNTSLHQEDFLKSDPGDERYASVWGILLDPTCSGSGMRGTRIELSSSTRAKSKEGKTEYQAKVSALSDFQVKMVSHAMAFPSVCRIVYSTCSVNVEENERVVQRVLGGGSGSGSGSGWELVTALEEWPRRGSLGGV